MSNTSKVALISGCRGQDASYLSKLLLSKGYKVVGLERRVSSPDYTSIQECLDNPNFTLEQGDITDFGSLTRLLKQYQPDEFYNLAAQSFVGSSWDQSVVTCEINFLGVCNCLEAIRLISPKTKFYQASTSEVYGDVLTSTQNEETLARPRSPYAASKYAAESLIKVSRDSYGTFACFARCFNHESKFRPKQFVTRKITSAIGDMLRSIENGISSFGSFDNQSLFEYALSQDVIRPIRLGNIDACRDFSHASDMVYGMWLMLQQEKPDDFVFASGTTRSIREFLDAAFLEVGVVDWSSLVVIDPAFYRPADVNVLCGDATKARQKLGWEPQVTFHSLVKEMIDYDCRGSKILGLEEVTYA
jgi:GDPmannose 4,6-dehydratase